jgi:hypothetical protein
MAIFWNDLEILQLIDACDKGERGGNNSGIDMAQTLARDRGVGLGDGDDAGFVRELLVLQDAGLVTWQVMSSIGRAQPIVPDNANDYLNNIRDFALTIAGRDRARGQIIRAPMPDAAEDDGRMIASLTLEDVARNIGVVYSPEQAARLVVEAGMTPDFDPGEGETWEKLLLVFVTFLHGSSGQRRELRYFLGAWLDDELHTGPSDEEREKIIGDLARQGWFVREGRLVAGEPVRRRRDVAPPAPALDQLHPIVWAAAEPQWKVKHLHDAVMEAAKAVDATLEAKIGRSDVSEVKLVTEAFSENRPPSTLVVCAFQTSRATRRALR